MRVLKMSWIVIATLAWGTAWAVPGVINYEGRLTDASNKPITVTTNVTFTFWDAATGGNQLGSGFSDTDAVTPDANGMYSTEVGDDPGDPIPGSVFSGDSVWLNVNVGGEDLLPRMRVDSAGFALHAAAADTATNASHASSADSATYASSAGHADTATSSTDSAALRGLPPTAFLNMSSDAYVVVKTTSDPVENGANLLAAYGEAKGLTPNGAALSATNRAAVLVPPANYDLGTDELTLDTEFVDLVGLSTAHEDQFIYGQTNGTGTGVLAQTANNVRIENLRVRSTLSTGVPVAGDTSDPAAYFPASNLPATVIRNCEFLTASTSFSWSTRLGVTYSGTYMDCTGGSYAFGAMGTASGRFTRCGGGDHAFGGLGTASGTFTDCTGGGDAFGGNYGTASGVFTGCTGDYGAFGGDYGTASGIFTDCTGGYGAFGGDGGSSTGARLSGCRMTGATWIGSWDGTMQNCQWAVGITAGANARIYGSKFLGNVNLNGTAAGIANSYVKGTIQNAGSASFNSGNVQSANVN